MNRISRNLCLTISAVLTLSFAANAQMSKQYIGDIPFDFQAAGHNYTAGKYTLGPIVTHGSVGVVGIKDKKTNKTRVFGAVTLNSDSWSNSGKLIFAKVDGLYRLTQIETPTFQMKMKRTWTDVKVAKNGAPAVETVTINVQ